MKYKYFLSFINQKREQCRHKTHHSGGLPLLIMIFYFAIKNLCALKTSQYDGGKWFQSIVTATLSRIFANKFPSILIFHNLYCFSYFVGFNFLLAFGADKKSPIGSLLEPSATFARRVTGNIRFRVFGIKHFLATDIAVDVNLIANFTLVPFECGAAVWAYYFVGITHYASCYSSHESLCQTCV